MIQVGTIIIPEPHIPSEHERMRYSIYVMECNVRRMKYMLENNYICSEYSDEEWEKFKKTFGGLKNID
jgi:hypothetical protein